jgi:alkylhydroperoxidase family enzyme
MPRLGQVSREQASAPIVTVMYDLLFEGRDPVAEPGTSDGTPGNWWTVFALVPDVLEHAVQGFGLYQSERRLLKPLLRELAQARVGFACASQFVYSQHCKSLRALGESEERISAVASWGVSELFTPIERAVLAYTDALVFDLGRVADAVFAALRRELSDEEILELTYITTLYLQHAVMSRALRTEFDDREEVIVEVINDAGDNTGAGRPRARRQFPKPPK